MMSWLTFHALQPPIVPGTACWSSDDDHDPDRSMDFDYERDFADQDPLTGMDMEEDAEMLTLLLKQMPSCIDTSDIEQLVRDIPLRRERRTRGHASADTQRDRGNGSRLYEVNVVNVLYDIIGMIWTVISYI